MRRRRASSWKAAQGNIERAKQLVDKYEASLSIDYLDPLPPEEQQAWDDLLKQMK